MSEINALRNAAKASKVLAKKAPKAVGPDLSKGFNVRGLNDQIIPFKAGTDVEKAKTWVKNFYTKDVEEEILSVTSEDELKQYEQISFKTKKKVMEPRDEGEFEMNAGEILALRTADEYQIRNSYVAEGARGQGIGAGLYRHIFDLAKKDGRKVISDSRLSPEAVAIWERMKQLGYPIHSYAKRIDQYNGEAIRAGAKREDDLPLYEYDPLGHGGSDIKRQAGQTAADKKGPKTDMFLEPQASAAPVGLVAAGNINTDKRKVLKNEDGTISTELSFSIGTEKGEVLIPQVVDGKKLTKEQAIEHYKKTGEHLGIFDTPENASKYADSLHKDQDKKYSKPK
jgi:predicted GNAT family acetyltransferase